MMGGHNIEMYVMKTHFGGVIVIELALMATDRNVLWQGFG
jgi:hypothetical protein